MLRNLRLRAITQADVAGWESAWAKFSGTPRAEEEAAAKRQGKAAFGMQEEQDSSPGAKLHQLL